MIDMDTSAQYWQTKYQFGDTPWDIGYPSPPICNFIQSLPDKNIRILIPGAGRAHEAAFLWQQGFHNICICDWADAAFDTLRQKFPALPEEKYQVADFFELDGMFDLILEQTFFCAIPPQQRQAYAEKCLSLLHPGGRVAGLLFNKHFEKPGPPFGGDIASYRALFSRLFVIREMIPAQNSIAPRLGNELFFVLEKPM